MLLKMFSFLPCFFFKWRGVYLCNVNLEESTIKLLFWKKKKKFRNQPKVKGQMLRLLLRLFLLLSTVKTGHIDYTLNFI